MNSTINKINVGFVTFMNKKEENKIGFSARRHFFEKKLLKQRIEKGWKQNSTDKKKNLNFS